MRDPKRIKRFCDTLAEIWENECPDWRFAQLTENIFRACGGCAFYIEDEAMLELFKSYFHREENE